MKALRWPNWIRPFWWAAVFGLMGALLAIENSSGPGWKAPTALALFGAAVGLFDWWQHSRRPRRR